MKKYRIMSCLSDRGSKLYYVQYRFLYFFWFNWSRGFSTVFFGSADSAEEAYINYNTPHKVVK